MPAAADRSALPARFGRSVRATLLGASPEQEKSFLPRIWAADEMWADLPHRLAMCGEDLVIVVDDLQQVRDPRIEEALAQLTRRTSQLRPVIICPNCAPPDLAAEWSSPFSTTYVAGPSLLYTAAEGRSLANSWGHSTDDDRALRLHERTGGWLLPMRLVLDASDSDAPDFCTVTAREFFRERIIPALLASHARESVLALCLPRALTESLVRHLEESDAHPSETQGRSLGQLVEHLEDQGLLTRSVDGAGPAWRFPTLLREELVANLTNVAPARTREVHRSLAHFYASKPGSGLLEDALVHARQAEDWALLDRLWSSHGSDLLLQSPARSIEAYASVPDDIASTSPTLTLARTIVRQTPRDSCRDEHRQRIRAYVQEGRRALGQLGSCTSLPDLLARTAAAMLSLRYEGACSQADELGKRLAKEVRERPQPDECRVTRRRLSWFFIQWGLTLAHQGQWQQAADRLTLAYEHAGGANSRPLSACAAAHLALVHALVGAPPEARHWLDLYGAFDAPNPWPAWLTTTPALVSGTLLALDELDEDTASRSILEMGEETHPPDMEAFVGFARAQHALIFGDPVAGLLHLDHLASQRAALFSDGGGTQLFARSRADLLLATGKLNRAAQHISDHEQQSSWLRTPLAQLHRMAGNHALAREIASSGVWDADVRLRDRIDLLSLSAAAALAMGDDAAAREAFIAGHQLAQEHGVPRAHSIIPSDVRAELHSRTGLTWPPEQQARLAAVGQVFPDRGELVELTERELVVVAEMAKYPTLADVATALTVSLNTVKKQASNLYRKLGVHDRESAVIRASHLGLLPTAAPHIARSPQGPGAPH